MEEGHVFGSSHTRVTGGPGRETGGPEIGGNDGVPRGGVSAGTIVANRMLWRASGAKSTGGVRNVGHGIESANRPVTLD